MPREGARGVKLGPVQVESTSTEHTTSRGEIHGPLSDSWRSSFWRPLPRLPRQPSRMGQRGVEATTARSEPRGAGLWLGTMRACQGSLGRAYGRLVDPSMDRGGFRPG